MRLLIVEDIAAIIASRRGWGIIPILILVGSIAMAILLLALPNSTNLFWAMNIFVIVLLAFFLVSKIRFKIINKNY
jgi:hypothetical protein